MNWGAAPDLQLHAVVPLVTNFSPGGGPINFGIGDAELGAKYRLIKESREIPEVGIYPFVELPSGNASRGLGVGAAWYRLPLWIQKSWGPWTTYGGGGEAIAKAPGYNDYPFAGWLLQRRISDALILGGGIIRTRSRRSRVNQYVLVADARSRWILRLHAGFSALILGRPLGRGASRDLHLSLPLLDMGGRRRTDCQQGWRCRARSHRPIESFSLSFPARFLDLNIAPQKDQADRRYHGHERDDKPQGLGMPWANGRAIAGEEQA